MAAVIEDASITAISSWIIDSALSGIDADRLVREFCEKLNEVGIPVARAHVACSFLHPMFRSFSVTWSRVRGVERNRFAHASAKTEAWLRSPFKALLDGQQNEMRFRIYKKEGLNRFPILNEFREQGFTDYLTTAIAFTSPLEKSWSHMDGALTSWLTDAPGGFTDSQLKALSRLLPRLGADQMPAREFLARLNRYFECTAGAVLDHGGEVLRFIGDAVLAIFPIVGPGGAERATRMAVAAARDSLIRLDRANAEPRPDGEPPIAFGLGLHVGDVLYGNIGVPERLEFSVVGHTANEVARLQDLSKTLDRQIVASNAFSSLVETEWESMGSHQLRGVAEPQQVYALKI